MFDVIIRGGDVVDGTGAPRRRADLGIRNGRIEVIGDLAGVEAVQELDATGRVVTPGFVDVHTHFDAQVFWDTTLSPSPLHGVTTVLAGNCGFTIAPLSADPDDGAYLKRMLARVEGMPLESLETGVPWGSWQSFGEYLGHIDNTLSVNAGFMVGHSALRRVVMGADSTTREATADELTAMERLLHDSLAAGGLGFSSSWARTHNDADGHMVPSRYAGKAELVALAGVAGQHEGTSLELIPCVGPFEDWALELMSDMSATARRPLNWNVMAVTARNLDECLEKLRAGDHARARGGKVVALTVPMSFGVRLSLDSGFILDALPGWEHFVSLPRAEKLDILADPDRRRRLDEQAQQDSPLRTMANWGRMILFDTIAPENEGFRGRTVAEVADELGVSTWDALCRVVVADELRTSFGTPNPEESDADWAARVQVWRDRRALIGASDAGAHLDLLASFNYSTIMLDQAVRRRGLLPLEEAVHLITQRPAELYGLRQRGRLAEGWWADVVVLDEHAIGSDPIAMRYDLPGGSGRLYAAAQGIDHVLCNGVEIVRHGEFTPARPGTVLRSGRDTADPSLD
jgi:N-acyl-D-aspartate/D-glutamate deacylase